MFSLPRFLPLLLALSSASVFAAENLPISGIDLKDQAGNAIQIRGGELKSSADAEILKESVAAEVKSLTGEDAEIPVPDATHWLERRSTKIGFVLIRCSVASGFLWGRLASDAVYSVAASAASGAIFLIYFPIGVAEPFFQELTGDEKYHIYNWGSPNPIKIGAAASFFAGILNWTVIAIFVGEINALVRDQIFLSYGLPGVMDFWKVLSSVALASIVQGPWAWFTDQWAERLAADGVPEGRILGARTGMGLVSGILAIVGSNLLQMDYITLGAFVLSTLGAGDLIFAGSLYRREIKGFYKKTRSAVCQFFVAGHGNSP